MSMKKDLNPAGVGILMSPGDMVKTLRELKEWSQVELAEETGISQANISAIENGRVEIGKQRAIVLAVAFDVHPASIMFADYDVAA
ncbi:MAG TPA: helix-turn-helix transcriptional regulator [Bacteriovoracaceae bacterium]|nr:helix-turn-helix transcriptional regulator [Bacteriovoracaceae bacterium]